MLSTTQHPRRNSQTSALKEESNTSFDGLVKEFGGISTSSGTQPLKPMKAQKRRDKRANQEVERELRIQEEQNNVVLQFVGIFV